MSEYCMYCDIANKANKSMAQTIDVLRKKQDTLIKALEIISKTPQHYTTAYEKEMKAIACAALKEIE